MPASSGRPGPGEITIPAGRSASHIGQAQVVVAADDGLRAELAQVLDEVVDERVVVVDYQDGAAHGSGTLATLAVLAPESRLVPRPSPADRCPCRGRRRERWEMRSSVTYSSSYAPTHQRGPGKGHPQGRHPQASGGGDHCSGRYTAPVPMDYRHSPWWVPAFMLAFFASAC